MTEAGRPDYNATIRFRQVRAGEPIFLLLGRDVVSGDVVRDWASRAHDEGAPPAIVESALQQADLMDAYGPKQVPDADHLSEAQEKQLAYQFDRRAWNARLLAKPNEVLLAERRGFTEAEARARLTTQHLSRLQAAALKALEVYPSGEASALLARVAASCGVHLAAIDAPFVEDVAVG